MHKLQILAASTRFDAHITFNRMGLYIHQHTEQPNMSTSIKGYEGGKTAQGLAAQSSSGSSIIVYEFFNLAVSVVGLGFVAGMGMHSPTITPLHHIC